jgi:ABC-type Fe3+-hydroxamate transport system substrate-binding protein
MNYWGGAAVDIEFLLRSRPDIIIVWLNFNKPEQVSELQKTIARRELANIPAVKNNRIYSFLEVSAGKDYFYTMVSISETLHLLYPNQYTAQMLEQDIKTHLALFYPAVSYTEYKNLRDRILISK